MKKQPHIVHFFSTFCIGGPEVRACDIINYLGNKFRHTIYAMDNNFLCKCKLAKEILPNVSIKKLEFNKKNTLKNIKYFRKILKANKPDLLLTYNWGSIECVLANSLNLICPNIHTEDGFNTDEAYKQKKRRIWTRRLALRKSFKIIVPSIILKNIALKKWKIPYEKLDYIPNGINIEDYIIDPYEKKSDIANIGIVASLTDVKNHLRLLRIINKMDKALSFKLNIIGDGPKREELEKFTKKNGLESKVAFFGYCEQPAKLLKKMDIFCLSSNSEQMPISVLEAMAAGCGVISTDVGDIKEMVSLENKQFIIQKEDEEGYANALTNLILDVEYRKNLGYKNQLKCIKKYGKNIMLQTYEKLYLDAIKLID